MHASLARHGSVLAAAVVFGVLTAGAPARSQAVGESFRDCAACPEMVVVPIGDFLMGSDTREEEQPVHEVTIPRSFAMSKYEVTFDEWSDCIEAGRCRETDDHKWGRGPRPVINVTWQEATAYAVFLSEKTGHTYRLPSEAEWEYAARAGTTTRFWWGDAQGEAMANCRTCGTKFKKRSAPVGSFAANPYGLHDLNGNIWEWTQDCWNESHTDAPDDASARTTGECTKRVVRGGSWYYIAKLMSAHYRTSFIAERFSYNIGIRLVRERP